MIIKWYLLNLKSMSIALFYPVALSNSSSSSKFDNNRLRPAERAIQNDTLWLHDIQLDLYIIYNSSDKERGVLVMIIILLICNNIIRYFYIRKKKFIWFVHETIVLDKNLSFNVIIIEIYVGIFLISLR